MRTLLAYDGSAGSILAAATMGSIAWPTDTTIRVVAVLPSQLQVSSPWLGLSDVPPAGFEEQVASELRSELAAVADRLRVDGRRIEVGVVRGRPADAILNDVATFEADLVVLGTRGHGSVASLVLGSVSAEVVDRSPVPVLIARQPAISRVLFAIDRSPGARDAEDLLRTWPIFDDVAIRVVSVDGSDEPVDGVATPRELAQLGAARLVAAGREADSVHRVGEPAAAIIWAARQWNADLVVLGSSGRSGLGRLLPGKVARHVLHGAHASVLMARAPVAPRPPRGGRRFEAARPGRQRAFARQVPSTVLTPVRA